MCANARCTGRERRTTALVMGSATLPGLLPSRKKKPYLKMEPFSTGERVTVTTVGLKIRLSLFFLNETQFVPSSWGMNLNAGILIQPIRMHGRTGLFHFAEN
jgi:hypothetical protein